MTKKRGRILHGIRIDKVSAVDDPAQENPLDFKVLLKRRGITEEEDPPRNEEGGGNMDLQKQFDEMAKRLEKLEGEKESASEENDKLKEQLAKAKAEAKLTDEEREHYAILDGDEADAFLKMTPKSRAGAIEKHALRDSVLEIHGQKIRKSAVGDEMFGLLAAMEKSRQEDEQEKSDLRKKVEEAEKAREHDALLKRADEIIPHIPGNLEARAALLKAAESIEDKDNREVALAGLKANNEAMGKAFAQFGSINAGQKSGDQKGAQEQLKKKAEEYAQKHEVPYSRALRAVLKAEPDLKKRADGRE